MEPENGSMSTTGPENTNGTPDVRSCGRSAEPANPAPERFRSGPENEKVSLTSVGGRKVYMSDAEVATYAIGSA
jgi:hypothetical protein